MNKPYIICHMLISIDGKVTGEFLNEANEATNEYYRINREFKADAFACGRVTMEGSFTNYWYPDLSQYTAAEDTKSDFVADKSGFYAVAFDRKGKLGWQTAKIIDEDPGYGNSHIIEVLTQDIDARYLAYLRETGVSYIFAGDDDIDINLALSKLKTLFGIEKLLLEGGSIINGAFQKANVIDELSLVLVPTVAGENSKPLFYESNIESYDLISTEPLSGGAMWMRYTK